MITSFRHDYSTLRKERAKRSMNNETARIPTPIAIFLNSVAQRELPATMRRHIYFLATIGSRPERYTSG